MPIYANRMNRMHFMGKKKNKEKYEQELQEIKKKHPTIYGAIKLAETSDIVTDVIKLMLVNNEDDDDFPVSEAGHTLQRLHSHNLSDNEKKALKLCLDTQNEWTVTNRYGIKKCIIDNINIELGNSQ